MCTRVQEISKCCYSKDISRLDHQLILVFGCRSTGQPGRADGCGSGGSQDTAALHGLRRLLALFVGGQVPDSAALLQRQFGLSRNSAGREIRRSGGSFHHCLGSCCSCGDTSSPCAGSGRSGDRSGGDSGDDSGGDFDSDSGAQWFHESQQSVTSVDSCRMQQAAHPQRNRQ